MIKNTNIVVAIELAACPEKKLNDLRVTTVLIIPFNSGTLQGRKRSKVVLNRLVI
jgi:hypothetical protein